MDQASLEMRAISKSFFGVKVLNDVSFSVNVGEVHALLGENGAGKSVLMKTLMGVYRPDRGEYRINGKKVRFRSPAEAMRNGVSMVYQEFGLVPHLTVAENIFMGRLSTQRRIIRWRRVELAARRVLERLGSNIAPTTIVGELKVAEQQEVEIARALSYDPKVFIMDEPSAALSREEIQHSFTLINRLREQGVAMIYITHKLEEVFEIADRLTIIRDGTIVGTYETKDLDYSLLVERMTGKKVSGETLRKESVPEFGQAILRVERLTGEKLFRDVTFSVGRGEIVAIAGVIGAGKTELAKAILGALPRGMRISGSVFFDGRELRLEAQNPVSAAKIGIGYVTEDRKREGLVTEQSVAFNIILPAFRRVTRILTLIPRLIAEVVSQVIVTTRLRPADPKKLVRNLSGGNQQKVVLGKWLASQSKLLILDEPTRGVDVGARDEIYTVVRKEAREKELGVLLLSSDLREIMSAADRILVMREGQIIAQRMPHTTSEKELLTLSLTGNA